MKRSLLLFFYLMALSLFLLVDMGLWLLSMLSVAIVGKTAKTKRDFSWGQKFGLPINRHLPNQGNTILLHCASMGEVVASEQLVRRLLALSPLINVVVTTNTLTGKDQVIRQFSDQFQQRVFHHYMPIDFGFLTGSLLRRSGAVMVLVLEVELWPNFIDQAYRQNIPTMIVNARLTPKTAAAYHKLSSLSQPMLDKLAMVFARNKTDVENYQSFGFDENRLTLAGNIKFDVVMPKDQLSDHWQQRLAIQHRTVIVAGSTHDGEEALMMAVYQQLKVHLPDLLLVIAPRHPHRFLVVAELLRDSGLGVQELSKNPVITDHTGVLLIDKMGVLAELYSIANVVFVGGSFVKKGGHNPIEAAMFAKPVVMGQHIYNNPEIINTIANYGGLKIATSEAELLSVLRGWLLNAEQGREAGLAGLKCLEDNQGALDTIINDIETRFFTQP